MTTIKTISAALDGRGIKYETRDGHILTGFGTPTYRSPNGQPGISIAINLDEGGEYLQVFAPMAYRVDPASPNRGAFFEACARVTYRVKLLRFAYDPKDGEVRISIEVPLEDAELTERQMLRALLALPQLVEEFDSVLRAALETGEIPEMPEPGIMRALMEMMRRLGGKAVSPALAAMDEEMPGILPRRGMTPPGLN